MASLMDAESMSASSRASEKLSLPTLQSKMKIDPEGYNAELMLVYDQFKSSLELFQQQAALNFTSMSGISADTAVAKDLGDRTMFLSHVTPFYPKELARFPNELVQFLKSSARTLLSGLRVQVTQALVLLVNRKIIAIEDTLGIFMELQTVGDRTLKTLAFSHVIHSIKRMNQKHKNDPRNKKLQNILFGMLQQEEEELAKRALITLCDLHRRKVWFDDRTANVICAACFHSSPRIMNATLSFLLDFEKIEADDDTDDSGSEDESATPQAHVVINKEAIYKANHKGTTSSKKKKKAKLERAVRSMKKQQRLSTENSNTNYYYSPLNHLNDPQGFAEKLFSRLQSLNGKFEVKMMMLKLIARTVGLHHLILLNFYPHLQKYVQPHQRDVINLLAAAVQACHDMVPPDAVEPLFKQIVNQFVHDKSRPEAITVGLNTVREICLRMPLLMTEDLLQDLVLYRKSNEKSVSASARSLLSLFREVCPSLLVKKDRGRPNDPKARPKAFGEVHVAGNIPGVELLDQEDDDDDDDDDNSDDDVDSVDGASQEDDDGVGLVDEDGSGENDGDSDHNMDSDSDEIAEDDDEESDEDNSIDFDDACDISDEEDGEECNGEEHDILETDASTKNADEDKLQAKKRKFSDFVGQVNAADKSLRALKKFTGEMGNESSNNDDGILSNEDFQRIRELKAKKDARSVLNQHGFKIPSSDQLSLKRVDAGKLEANIRRKFTKDERLAMIREGREDRGKYQAKSSLKKKKTGGSSNQEKSRKKAMPLVAKRAKIARSRIEKKKQARRAGTQFRGRKAWK